MLPTKILKHDDDISLVEKQSGIMANSFALPIGHRRCLLRQKRSCTKMASCLRRCTPAPVTFAFDELAKRRHANVIALRKSGGIAEYTTLLATSNVRVPTSYSESVASAANAFLSAHISNSKSVARCAHMVLFSNLVFSSSGVGRASPHAEREKGP